MSPLQNACLLAIRDMTVDGVSPSYEELQHRLGLGSKSGVFRLIEELERQGFIRREPSRYRSISVIERQGGGISDARIAAMSDEALESALTRISAALSHRRALTSLMRERDAA